MPSVRELYQTFREERDLRFNINPVTGIKSPSVTTIINFDADFFVSEKDLAEYAAQGSIIDAKVRQYINTGVWVAASEMPCVASWVDVLAKGDLGLKSDAGDFLGFLKRYPFKDMTTLSRLYHKEDLYNGEVDFIGTPLFQGAEESCTVVDIKRTASKGKNGMQLAAYCQMMNFHQGIIVVINDKTKQGFSKPKVYDRDMIDMYYQQFLVKREEFRDYYGI